MIVLVLILSALCLLVSTDANQASDSHYYVKWLIARATHPALRAPLLIEGILRA